MCRWRARVLAMPALRCSEPLSALAVAQLPALCKGRLATTGIPWIPPGPAASVAKVESHIRATANNPKSSRGTLFVMLDFAFKSGLHGSVHVVDLAGAEDPASMAGVSAQVGWLVGEIL